MAYQSRSSIQQGRGPLDAIANALNVVNQVYGIQANSAALDKHRADMDFQDQERARLSEDRAAKKDPNSSLAQAARQGLKDEGISVSDSYSLEQLQAAGYDPAATRKIREEVKAKREGVDPFTTRLNELKASKLGAEISKLKSDGGGPGGRGKQLPAGDAATAGGANSAVSALADISGMVESNQALFGPAQGLLTRGQSFFGVGKVGEDARTVNSALKQRAQIIGKYLEGGKMTDSDIIRYQESLPQPGDSPVVAQNKILSLQRLVAQKQAGELDALGQAGYNVGDIKRAGSFDLPQTQKSLASNRSPLIPEANASAGRPTAEDLQAFQWAKSNSGDPRAKSILQTLQMKGIR